MRNNPEIKVGFINQDFIVSDNHIKYMEEHITEYFVCLHNDVPVGYIGVVKNDIRLAVHPKFQGNGIGLFMLEEIIKMFPKSEAKIKVNNVKSLKLFEKAGFDLNYYIYSKS